MTKTSIHNTHKKIKLAQAVLLACMIILGLTASFILGRLSALQNAPRTSVLIQKAACPIPIEIAQKTANHDSSAVADSSSLGAFVASKNGTKFYPADCSYADRILDANKVWFETQDDAVAAGYEASTQCSS